MNDRYGFKERANTQDPHEEHICKLFDYFGGANSKRKESAYARKMSEKKVNVDILGQYVNHFIDTGDKLPLIRDILGAVSRRTKAITIESRVVVKCVFKICDGSMHIVIDRGDGVELSSRCKCHPAESNERFDFKMREAKIHKGWINIYESKGFGNGA